MGNTGSWVLSLPKKTSGATVWTDAAPATAAGDLFYARTITVPDGIPEDVKDFNIGQQAIGAEYWTNFNISGQIGELAVRYAGAERIIGQAAGNDTVTLIEAAIAWQHESLPQASNVGKALGCIVDKKVGNPYVYPSCRVTGFEVKTADRMMVITPNAIFNQVTRPSYSLASGTPASAKLAALFNSMKFRLKAASGGSISDSNKFDISDISVSWDRRQEASAVNRADGTPDEPESNGGAAEGKLRVVFPNYATASDFLHTENIVVGTAEKASYIADLTFTGPTLGAQTYKWLWEFSKLVLASFEAPGSGPLSKVPVTVEFDILVPDADPPGMTWAFTAPDGFPWRSTIVNANSVSSV